MQFGAVFSAWASASVSGHARTSVAACAPAASPRQGGVCDVATLRPCHSVHFLLPPNQINRCSLFPQSRLSHCNSITSKAFTRCRSVRVCTRVLQGGLNVTNLARCHKCITSPIWQIMMSTSWRAEPLLQPSRCPSTPSAAFAIAIDLTMWGELRGAVHYRAATWVLCRTQAFFGPGLREHGDGRGGSHGEKQKMVLRYLQHLNHGWPFGHVMTPWYLGTLMTFKQEAVQRKKTYLLTASKPNMFDHEPSMSESHSATRDSGGGGPRPLGLDSGCCWGN